MGFCGKRLHDRSKKIAAPNVFFPACNVRIVARAGSPWFFLRGRECGKALNYKGICDRKSKRTGVWRKSSADRAAGEPSTRQFRRTSGAGNAAVAGQTTGLIWTKADEKKPERAVRV
jgi:hypothetical protein